MQIRRSTHDGLQWPDPQSYEQLRFDASGYERFVANASYSALLDERFILYTRRRLGAFGEVTASVPCWCEDPDDPATARVDIEFANILASSPRSSPARPIPDVYACFVARQPNPDDLELQWVDLDESGGESSFPIITYPGAITAADPNDRLELLGLGALRVPAQDEPGGPGKAFVLYAVLYGPRQAAEPFVAPLGTPVNLVRQCWIDCFYVLYNGNLGGTFADMARQLVRDVPGQVRVFHARRLLPRFPGPAAWISDNEQYLGSSGEPFVVVGVGPSPLPRSQPTEIWALSAFGGDPIVPTNVWNNGDPLLVEAPASQERLSDPVSAVPNADLRLDPEPVRLATGTVVYYRQDTYTGGGPVPGPFPGNLPLSFYRFHRANAPERA